MYGLIYCATNIVTRKKYVGQTTFTICDAKKRHLKSKTRFGNSIRKYGSNSFKWEQLDLAQSREELNNLEESWILKLNTLHPNGYNMSAGTPGSEWKLHDETRKAISLAKIGIKRKSFSEEHRRRLGEAKIRSMSRPLIKYGLGGKIIAINGKEV